ncbi:tRNA pseudouridine(55) synthase TruB [Erythrobacter sp. SCSIO 43205]|uniref:tRNA pseudouridine(55) synthase TruB n=1 Tax=Erythrobacter sp. SCSIO 43205 TaxID=2779361 RepID=UPI001CA9F602|nr:tRNA pseudouridine(55) synthase TruB [Erythrobacter sp. SCSIO 43205]UAB77885.1 tRNA pseudouridine(55) synthase TruB [Erythrobacter sp. SCSIO 43205]
MTSDKKPAPNGWIILDKPRGLGSTQGVAAVKRNLREAGFAKTKVGHGGTLDPLAEGVLPIALGEATKLAGRMLDASKIYEFTVAFGVETDTLDTEGKVVEQSDVRPTLAEVEAVLPQFTGEIEQVPPAYSALKVDGKRAYDLARAGEEVELKTRAVTIHELSICHPRVGGDPASSAANDQSELDSRLRGNDEVGEVTLQAHVSKGTYIRSLARDIAHALGTCGHVTYLRRSKSGPFTEAQAISLDKLNEIANGAELNDLLLPLEAGLDDIPALSLSQTDAQALQQGRVVSGLPQPSGLHCAMLGSRPIALVEISGGTAKVVRGFNLPDVAE